MLELETELTNRTEKSIWKTLFPPIFNYGLLFYLVALIAYGLFVYWFVYILIKDQANVDLILASKTGFKYWMLERANIFIYILSNLSKMLFIIGLIIIGLPFLFVSYAKLQINQLKCQITNIKLVKEYEKQLQLAKELRDLKEFKELQNEK